MTKRIEFKKNVHFKNCDEPIKFKNIEPKRIQFKNIGHKPNKQ